MQCGIVALRLSACQSPRNPPRSATSSIRRRYRMPPSRRLLRGQRLRTLTSAAYQGLERCRDSSVSASIPRQMPSPVRSPAVVMADVARLAGVSQQTVSRVLNDSPHVRADTRARVLEAVRKLEYRPNRLARALVTGRTRTLGVVSFDTTLHGPASTLLGIERAAHDAGYSVSIASSLSLDSASVGGAIERLRE